MWDLKEHRSEKVGFDECHVYEGDGIKFDVCIWWNWGTYEGPNGKTWGHKLMIHEKGWFRIYWNYFTPDDTFQDLLEDADGVETMDGIPFVEIFLDILDIMAIRDVLSA